MVEPVVWSTERERHHVVGDARRPGSRSTRRTWCEPRSIAGCGSGQDADWRTRSSRSCRAARRPPCGSAPRRKAASRSSGGRGGSACPIRSRCSPGGVDDVLDAERHAGERTLDWVAIEGARRIERTRGIEVGPRLEAGLARRGCGSEAGPHHRLGGDARFDATAAAISVALHWLSGFDSIDVTPAGGGGGGGGGLTRSKP